jgi:predicted TIM-barrel fold metal-dependent hydrolase
MDSHGFRAIDADLHLIEPPDLWEQYIEPAFKDMAPRGSTSPEMGGRDILLYFNGKFPHHDAYDPSRWMPAIRKHMAPAQTNYQFAIDRGWNAESQLMAMDMESLDIGVMFPSRGLYALGFDSVAVDRELGLEPVLAAAIARAYNNWLDDFCRTDPRRLIGVAMIAPHDVDMAVEETRRCVTELGFRGIFLKPGFVNRRAWHDPAYDPLWAECERLNVPVAFHGSMDRLEQDFGMGIADKQFLWHTFSHSLGPMLALGSFIAGGVFDRFPRLRAAFLEANCGWAPWLVRRLEDHYEDYIGRHEATLEREVSEYFVENCYASVEADESAAKYTLDEFGDDNIVFSTDYPHPDAKFPHATERFLTLPFSETAKRKILWDNSVRLYGIEDLVADSTAETSSEMTQAR